MQNERDLIPTDKEERPESELNEDLLPPEIAENPVPGIKHEYEPDAENIMPAQDQPGTF